MAREISNECGVVIINSRQLTMPITTFLVSDWWNDVPVHVVSIYWLDGKKRHRTRELDSEVIMP
jgi:hypothetical protein